MSRRKTTRLMRIGTLAFCLPEVVKEVNGRWNEGIQHTRHGDRLTDRFAGSVFGKPSLQDKQKKGKSE